MAAADAADAPPPRVFIIDGLARLETAVGSAKAILRDPRTASLLSPRRCVVNVQCVDRVSNAPRMLALLRFAQDQLGWEVRPADVRKIRKVCKFNAALHRLETTSIPAVLANPASAEALETLRRHGIRLLRPLSHVRIRGTRGIMHYMAIERFAKIQKATATGISALQPDDVRAYVLALRKDVECTRSDVSVPID